jgi:hypothetical protein
MKQWKQDERNISAKEKRTHTTLFHPANKKKNILPIYLPTFQIYFSWYSIEKFKFCTGSKASMTKAARS